MSILTEILLARHRRKQKRYAATAANEYAGGKKKRGGLFGRRKRNDRAVAAGGQDTLPAHTAPADVRDSYATEQTRVGHSRGTDTVGAGKYNKYGESGYDQPATTGIGGGGYRHHNPMAPTQPVQQTAPLQNTVQNPVEVPGTAQYPTAGAGNYQYGDGVYNAARP